MHFLCRRGLFLLSELKVCAILQAIVVAHADTNADPVTKNTEEIFTAVAQLLTHIETSILLVCFA